MENLKAEALLGAGMPEHKLYLDGRLVSRPGPESSYGDGGAYSAQPANEGPETNMQSGLDGGVLGERIIIETVC